MKRIAKEYLLLVVDNLHRLQASGGHRPRKHSSGKSSGTPICGFCGVEYRLSSPHPCLVTDALKLFEVPAFAEREAWLADGRGLPIEAFRTPDSFRLTTEEVNRQRLLKYP